MRGSDTIMVKIVEPQGGSICWKSISLSIHVWILYLLGLVLGTRSWIYLLDLRLCLDKSEEGRPRTGLVETHMHVSINWGSL